jgi:branched-chain amino acid transport system ATP-binding protein
MKSILEVKDLKKYYKENTAVNGLNFNLYEGEILGFLGPNGAGKSTTLRAVSNLVPASSGNITFQKQDITNKKTVDIVKKGVTLVPEGRRVFANLTVLENLHMGAYARKDKAEIQKDILKVFDLFPRLKEREWQSAGTLSGGEQQMLAIGRALMSSPKLLMMDEPSLGLALILVQEVFKIIQNIHEQGMTILLIEQNAMAALQIADYGYVMETGNIVLEGPGKELADKDEVRKAYLGQA